MSGRRAQFTQPECTRFLKAAKKAGACEVEVRVGEAEAKVIIRFYASSSPTTDTLEASEEIVL